MNQVTYMKLGAENRKLDENETNRIQIFWYSFHEICYFSCLALLIIAALVAITIVIILSGTGISYFICHKKQGKLYDRCFIIYFLCISLIIWVVLVVAVMVINEKCKKYRKSHKVTEDHESLI